VRDQFLPCEPKRIEEGSHRGLAVAPSSVMFSLIVVLVKPDIQIVLQGWYRVVDLPAERDAVELVEHGLVKTLHDPVGLRRSCPGARVIDVLDGQVELIFVVLGITAVLGAPIRQHTQERYAVAVEEWHDAVVEQVGCWQRSLAIVELGECHLRVGVDERLLIDTAHTFEGADIKGALGTAVAGTFRFKLAVRFLFQFGAFERGQLRFGQHKPFLGGSGLQRLEALVHGLEIVTQPDAAHALRRHAQRVALEDFVGDTDLAVGWQLQGQLNYHRLDLRIHAVLQQRTVVGDFLQGGFTAFIVQFPETVKAIARIAPF
jgi:hypothetical protein